MRLEGLRRPVAQSTTSPHCLTKAKHYGTRQKPEGFIPVYGGYRNPTTYQKAEIIYDGTVYFTKRIFTKYDRTIDQMVQAAHSGKQNIA